jgi:hypothetical protein
MIDESRGAERAAAGLLREHDVPVIVSFDENRAA